MVCSEINFICRFWNFPCSVNKYHNKERELYQYISEKYLGYDNLDSYSKIKMCQHLLYWNAVTKLFIFFLLIPLIITTYIIEDQFYRNINREIMFCVYITTYVYGVIMIFMNFFNSMNPSEDGKTNEITEDFRNLENGGTTYHNDLIDNLVAIRKDVINMHRINNNESRISKWIKYMIGSYNLPPYFRTIYTNLMN
jgi:hypothetical protein